jgi:predicted negative regulator of RcsB-dependent stress response
MLYAEFVRQLEGNDAGRVNDAATAVMDRFAATGYASQAALLAAQVTSRARRRRAPRRIAVGYRHAEADLKGRSKASGMVLLDEKIMPMR